MIGLDAQPWTVFTALNRGIPFLKVRVAALARDNVGLCIIYNKDTLASDLHFVSRVREEGEVVGGGPMTRAGKLRPTESRRPGAR